ncbi:hypothetical protein [Natronolimnohabitans innermongolicus]|uniref:Uncharacterized protein n=1 Tax=Natronolimnohabitans innermongolicus JCM 12255 TaxID=1227499 RepID=L9WN79_9EURY|nr:hypothetical protein [Natronolimnohabitans innermongolicus]ELY50914.1 hypothetical protein C493_18051 [Natronolimnohabitans innermongolicus JCM 12255]
MVLETDLEDVAAKHDDLPAADDVYDEDEAIPIEEVFDDAFVAAKTDFESFDELVAASPSEADSAADLEKVPHREWNEFIAENSEFDSEREFVFAGRDHWVAKQLDLA